MKQHIRPVLLIITFISIFFLLCFPKLALAGSKEGLMLWFNTLIPTLLPFLILSSLLRLLIPKRHNLWFMTGLGIISGYPIGAKLIAEMDTKGPKDFFLSAANNPSPMFVLILVGQTTLNLGGERYLFMATLILCSLLSAFLGNLFLPNSKMLPVEQNQASSEPLLKEIDNILLTSFLTITKIGGYVILFSIFSEFMTVFFANYPTLQVLLAGSLELTSGIFLLQGAAFSIGKKIILASILTGFGGLCALAQTKSVTLGTGLSIRYYLVRKLLCGLLAGLFSAIYLAFL